MLMTSYWACGVNRSKQVRSWKSPLGKHYVYPTVSWKRTWWQCGLNELSLLHFALCFSENNGRVNHACHIFDWTKNRKESQQSLPWKSRRAKYRPEDKLHCRLSPESASNFGYCALTTRVEFLQRPSIPRSFSFLLPQFFFRMDGMEKKWLVSKETSIDKNFR